ncbi:MAG: cell division protein FtsQ/DivIB [Lautropia sp.]
MTLWQDARALNTIANGLVMMAFASLAAAAIWWAAHRTVFELKGIEVGVAGGRTLQHVNADTLAAAGVHELAGNFFTVDLEEVRQTFEEAPWVRRAQVRRIWPNRLSVEIEEHRPLARWGDGRFVNTYGELFSADPREVGDAAQLLEFAGPEGTQGIVTRRFHELSEQLAALSLVPRKIVLSDRQAWTARLDNGMTLLIGRDEGVPVNDRITRWVAVHPQIQARFNERTEVVDLRYPNGFAIRAPGALDGDAGERGRSEVPRRP